MGLDNAERQARWREKGSAEIERLRKAAAGQSEQLVEARREIEIAALELENATLKKALAHERKEHAEAKTRAAKAASAFEETVKAQATIPGLLQRVRDLEEKLVYERLRKSATANPSQAGKNAKSVNARRMPFSQAIALILLESGRTTEAGGPRGCDAGKKINGRKRHALVDTDGRGLVLEPHPASIQDRDGGGPLLRASRRIFPFNPAGLRRQRICRREGRQGHLDCGRDRAQEPRSGRLRC